MSSRIVVGIDASPPSVEALRRGVDEARWRDVPLEVVYVFHPPDPAAAFPAMPEPTGEDAKEIEVAREKASKRLGEWLQGLDVDLDGVDVRWLVVADRKPSRALIERSKDADLVVVASRGRGGFAGLRLGSVSEQVSRHAHCPVLIVRDSTGG